MPDNSDRYFFTTTIWARKKYLSLMSGITRAIVCSGNHDLDEQQRQILFPRPDRRGEKVSVAVVRHHPRDRLQQRQILFHHDDLGAEIHPGADVQSISGEYDEVE